MQVQDAIEMQVKGREFVLLDDLDSTEESQVKCRVTHRCRLDAASLAGCTFMKELRDSGQMQVGAEVRHRGSDLLHDLHNAEEARSDSSHMQVRCSVSSLLHVHDSSEETKVRCKLHAG